MSFFAENHRRRRAEIFASPFSARYHRRQCKDLAFGRDGQLPAVLFGDQLHALQPEAVFGGVLLAGDGQAARKAQLPGKVVVAPHGEHPLPAAALQRDHPLFGRELHHRLDGVARAVIEKGDDVHRLHERERLAFDKVGEFDAVLLAVDAALGEQHV